MSLAERSRGRPETVRKEGVSISPDSGCPSSWTGFCGRRSAARSPTSDCRRSPRTRGRRYTRPFSGRRPPSISPTTTESIPIAKFLTFYGHRPTKPYPPWTTRPLSTDPLTIDRRGTWVLVAQPGTGSPSSLSAPSCSRCCWATASRRRRTGISRRA